MKIYNYDRHSGILISESEAVKSPKEKDVYLIPAFATGIKPPVTKKNEIAIMTSGHWKVKTDRIDQVYYSQDGTKHIIQNYGDDIPASCIQIPPPDEFHDTHDGADWILNTKKLKTFKLKQNAEKRRQDIAKPVSLNSKTINTDSNTMLMIIGQYLVAKIKAERGLVVKKSVWKYPEGWGSVGLKDSEDMILKLYEHIQNANKINKIADGKL